MLDSIKVVANIPPRMMITANGLKEKTLVKVTLLSAPVTSEMPFCKS